MKRILAFLLSTLLLLGLCACGSGEQATGKPAQPGTSTLPLSSGAETEWVTKSKEYRPFPAGITVRDLARIGDSLLISLSDGGTFSDGGRHSLALCRYRIAEDGSPVLSDPQEIPLEEARKPDSFQIRNYLCNLPSVIEKILSDYLERIIAADCSSQRLAKQERKS